VPFQECCGRSNSLHHVQERQCQDHVRDQEHQEKPVNQFAVSLEAVHILLTDFPTGASDPVTQRCQAFLAAADAG